MAVGVHTTQFAIHEPRIGLYEPVLALAAETVDAWHTADSRPVLRVAGLLGGTRQAVREARTALDLGYHLGLLGFGGLPHASLGRLLEHARVVARTLPVMGFYLQPAVGGRELPYRFWREFCDIEGVVAVKVAPFDRYRTLDVLRAVCDSDRSDEIALYTGNDDNIVADLVSRYSAQGRTAEFVGGLLGHWAVWTRSACRIWRRCREAAAVGSQIPERLLGLNLQVTEMNSALFDVRNRFAGCIAGIHEVLRRQGLLQGVWCLDKDEALSSGQAEEIDRVATLYPDLTDDGFVAENLTRWLA